MKITAETITVTRSKLYPRPARPGAAWIWHYEVMIPGEPNTFGGTSLSWVRILCKRKRPGMPVAFAWNARHGGEP